MSAVAFSPDDRIMATSTNLVIQLWPITSERALEQAEQDCGGVDEITRR